MLKILLAVALALEIGLAAAADKAPAVPATGPAVSGKVLEVLDVEGFTYLRLKTRDGEL